MDNNNQNKLRKRDYYDLFEPMFDSFFDFPSKKVNALGLLKTDIKENEDRYELSIEVPGLEKNEININLNNGYLTVSTHKQDKKEEVDKENNYIVRERFYGSYKRSFFIGKDIKYKDIEASMDKGILHINVNKPKEIEESSSNIEIK